MTNETYDFSPYCPTCGSCGEPGCCGDAACHYFAPHRDAIKSLVECHEEARHRIEQLEAENARLRGLSSALVEKCDAVVDDTSFRAIHTLAHSHGVTYAGPTWTDELEALRTALAHHEQGG